MDATATARQAIQQLVAGSYIPRPPADYGSWAGIIGQLADTLRDDGPTAVVDALAVASRADRGLAALVADLPPPPPTTASGLFALPDVVTDALTRAAPCAPWLDAYVAYASHVSPVTPAPFHEAAGLFLIATAIARRLCVRLGAQEFYPVLFVLFIAPPGVYAKTAAFRPIQEVLRAADLEHLLLPDSTTPESLFRQMDPSYLPSEYHDYSDDLKTWWLKQRAQAAQRAWLLDEAGFLFKDLQKDYMAAMLGMLLKLYDAPVQMSRETISRGLSMIKNASLSFFGATTPKGIEDHLRNERLWDEGLWSRFALVSPDAPPHYAIFPDATPVPSDLVMGLHHVNRHFPRPHARFVEKTADGSVKFDYIEHEIIAPEIATLDWDARTVWNAYDRAMRYDIPSQGLDETLYASYTRFPSQALRVAMLLAAVDAAAPPAMSGVVIEVRHMARAIRIVEGWRQNLHRLWRDGMQSSEIRLGGRLLAILRESALSGATVRTLQQRCHKPAKEVKEVLDVLRLAGQVDLIETKAANGRTVQLWKAS